jgi:hypothetical protein
VKSTPDKVGGHNTQRERCPTHQSALRWLVLQGLASCLRPHCDIRWHMLPDQTGSTITLLCPVIRARCVRITVGICVAQIDPHTCTMHSISHANIHGSWCETVPACQLPVMSATWCHWLLVPTASCGSTPLEAHPRRTNREPSTPLPKQAECLVR